jgi:hypothetical protein
LENVDPGQVRAVDERTVTTARSIVATETPFLGAQAIALFDQASADLRESGGDPAALLHGALNGLDGATTESEGVICQAVAYVAAMRIVADDA